MKLKNAFVFLAFLGTSLSLPSCSENNTLLVLNWGEYINQDLVDAFEEKYDCNVSISIADSNELFYSKVKSGTTAYDLVCPSDYMVEKMVDKDMLAELDFTKLPNYSRDHFMTGVNQILNSMDSNGKEYSHYCSPYFWGTFGLMYNKKAENVEAMLNQYGWDAYFNPEILPESLRFGMYNVPRDVFAATMFANHMSPNDFNEETLKISTETLSKRHFDQWGTDTLKKGIEAGNLDLAYVYTGDFLDMVYATCETVEDYEKLDYGIYIPDETIAFMDNLVMPKNARHKDLAYEFMNYMLDASNLYNNASVVGYCTPDKRAYEDILKGKDSVDDFNRLWAKANETYYPETDEFKGTPLTYFNEDTLTKLTNMVNKVKVN